MRRVDVDYYISKVVLLGLRRNCTVQEMCEFLVKTKELLHSLVNNTSKTDVYRRRVFIAMHDAIKHAYAEDLSIEQVLTISSVTKDILLLEKVTRDDYRSLSKRIRKCGLRILPEPKLC